MGKVNILGLIVIALGAFLVFLGVTGRYKVFVGGSASSSNATASNQPSNPLPNQGTVPSSNTAVPGVTFNILNQDPVPTVGNLPNSITPQQGNVLQQVLQQLLHQGSI